MSEPSLGTCPECGKPYYKMVRREDGVVFYHEAEEKFDESGGYLEGGLCIVEADKDGKR